MNRRHSRENITIKIFYIRAAHRLTSQWAQGGGEAGEKKKKKRKENRFDTDNQTVTTEIHNKRPSVMRHSRLLICSGGAASQVVKQKPPGQHSTAPHPHATQCPCCVRRKGRGRHLNEFLVLTVERCGEGKNKIWIKKKKKRNVRLTNKRHVCSFD